MTLLAVAVLNLFCSLQESPAPTPEPVPFPDDPSVSATLESAQLDDGTPVLRVSGTTNLPDLCRLTLYAYYAEIAPGRHLSYRAVEIKEGKFSLDFPLYKEHNLAGKHLVEIRFNPFHQPQPVPDSKGLEKTVELTVGTAEDLEAARTHHAGDLVKKIQRITAIATEAFDLIAANPAPAITDFETKAAAWKGEIEAIAHDCYASLEYRALGFSGIADEIIENLTRGVYELVELVRQELTAPGAEPDRKAAIEELQKFVFAVAKSYEEKLIPPPAANPQELRDAVKAVADHLARAADPNKLFEEAAVQGTDPTTAAEAFRKTFTDGVLKLNQILPDPVKSKIVDVTRSGTDVCRLVIDAARGLAPPSNAAGTHDQARAACEALSSALEEYFQADRH